MSWEHLKRHGKSSRPGRLVVSELKLRVDRCKNLRGKQHFRSLIAQSFGWCPGSLKKTDEAVTLRSRKRAVSLKLLAGLFYIMVVSFPSLSFGQMDRSSPGKFLQNPQRASQEAIPKSAADPVPSGFPKESSRGESRQSSLVSSEKTSSPELTTSKNEAGSRKLSERGREITPRAFEGESEMATSGSAWFTLVALLLIVGLILVAAQLFKKFSPAAVNGLPAEAMEVLGKCPLDQRQVVHLVRLGSRILVIGSSPDGLRTLTEVADSAEVNYLTGLCKQRQKERSVAQTFRQLLGQNDSNDELLKNKSDMPSEFESRLGHQFSTATVVNPEDAHG